MTNEDRARLRALAEAATQGQWTHDDENTFYATFINEWDQSETDILCDGDSWSPADADYIAAANPQTMLALLDRLDALEAALGDIRRTADEWHVLNPDVRVLNAGTYIEKLGDMAREAALAGDAGAGA